MSDTPVATRLSKLAVASVLAVCVPFGFVFLLILHDRCPCVEIADNISTTAFLAGFFSIFAAIALGYVARRSIQKKPHLLRGLKVAKAGLVMGYGWLALLIWAALFGPSHHDHPGFDEGSAVGSLRVISAAVHEYAKSHRGPPESLQQINKSGLIDQNLGMGLKSGYQFSYQLRSTHHDGVLDGFEAVAVPVLPCITGKRAFYIDDAGIIRVEVIHSDSKPFTTPSAKSPPL